MKYIVAILLLITAAWFAKEAIAPTDSSARQGPPSDWVIEDSWTTASTTLAGIPIRVQFNFGLSDLVANSNFTRRVTLTIPLNHAQPDGLPNEAEAQQLKEIESFIRSKFTPANDSLLAVGLATAGRQEYILYTSPSSYAQANYKELVSAIDHHQILFLLEDDPNWETYKVYRPLNR